MRQLLSKAFVVPFYKAFIGFFLVLIIIFGVFIKSEVHVMLGYQIIQSSYAIAGLIVSFGLYSFLHWSFQRRLLLKPQYKVFHQIGLFKPNLFFRNQVSIWFSNHIILILYTAFLSMLCIGLKLWHILILLWLVLILLFSIFSVLIFYQLRNPLKEINIKSSAVLVRRSFKIPYNFWLLNHLKENRPMLLLVSKLASLFLLNLFFSSYYSGGYDSRWLQFAILCVSFVNLPLLIEKRDFENSALSYFLSIPSSFFKKSKSHFLQTLFLIFPELIFIIFQTVLSDISSLTVSLLLFITTLHLGLYGLLNYFSDPTKLGKYAFMAFFIQFFSILYGFPTWALAMPLLFLWFISIKSNYKI